MQLPPMPAELKKHVGDVSVAQLRAWTATGMTPSVLPQALAYIAECDAAIQQEALKATSLAAEAAARSAFWTMIAAIVGAVSAIASLVAAVLSVRGHH